MGKWQKKNLLCQLKHRYNEYTQSDSKMVFESLCVYIQDNQAFVELKAMLKELMEKIRW